MTKQPYEEARTALAEFGIKDAQIMAMTSDFNSARTSPMRANSDQIVLSTDPKLSQIPPRFIRVPDVETLKRIGGIPDEKFQSEDWDNALPIPSAATPGVLAQARPQDKVICDALFAYVYGDSSKVQDYRDTLNRLRFPMKVAVFASEDAIIVKSGEVYVISDPSGHDNPVSVVAPEVIIEEGGTISWETTGTMKTDSLIVVPREHGTSDDPVNSYQSIGGDAGNGANGNNGDSGKNGKNGSAGKDNKSSCDVAATNGTNGSRGEDAAMGQDGTAGPAASPVYVDTGTMNGHFVAASNGGKGGKGGNAGKGGTGGSGGDGGAATSQCTAGKGGDGGDGGSPAKGGNGGKGGDGASIFFNYKNGSPTFDNNTTSGSSGDGGHNANGGAGGTGGTGSTTGAKGTTNTDTATGGTGGAGGKAGSIYVNGSSIG
ncbi:hypothetical protein SAMN05444141_11335 [Pseudovibrio denitrificans]|uniref:Uncharacterized protein n=1 Tax=Pseudovibrio denitrificans TaxID=258256 RepID=A0A1I7DYQ2_9HYPH|nr:hypothetical protein [Pseudovibrio denitrificans]SFU16804.1 hypothetical protein SAMN05444141_11335 [Pseudovibrio denitrificans]